MSTALVFGPERHLLLVLGQQRPSKADRVMSGLKSATSQFVLTLSLTAFVRGTSNPTTDDSPSRTFSKCAYLERSQVSDRFGVGVAWLSYHEGESILSTPQKRLYYSTDLALSL